MLKIKLIPANFPLFLILLIASVLTACGNADLSRGEAEKLIAGFDEFKYPQVIVLQNAAGDPFGLDKAGGSEKTEDAEKRNLEVFLSYNPKIAALNHLGLISIDQQLLREERGVGLQVPAQWFFQVIVKANEKGSQLWKSYGIPSKENEIPVAVKEIISVNGITNAAENQRIAEFTWRWKPNDIGLALHENTEDFKNLPENIRQGLLGQTEGNRQKQTENWSGERSGKALFQKYDDGWKVIRILN